MTNDTSMCLCKEQEEEQVEGEYIWKKRILLESKKKDLAGKVL